MMRLELLFVNYEPLKGKVDAKGFCRQSAGYTCGPASAVMFLYIHGTQKSEKEIATHCRSSLFNGTNAWLLCGYLNSVSEKNFKLQFGENNRPTPPYIEKVNHSGLFHHWLMVKDIEGDKFVLYDPWKGITKILKTKHIARSQGLFITE